MDVYASRVAPLQRVSAMTIRTGILPAMRVRSIRTLKSTSRKLRKFHHLAGRDIGALAPRHHVTRARCLRSPRNNARPSRASLPTRFGASCRSFQVSAAKASTCGRARPDGAGCRRERAPRHAPHNGALRHEAAENVVDYFTAIGRASGLDLVLHIYPGWTRASSVRTRLPSWLACLDQVHEGGHSGLNKYAVTCCVIRETNPRVTVLTCMTNICWASMVQGSTALGRFGSFIPQTIAELYAAVSAGDLKTAMEIQARINPLKDVVYGGGEPTGDAHARMKMAMYLAGILKSPAVQPPTRLPVGAELKAIADALRASGMLKRTAA